LNSVYEGEKGTGEGEASVRKRKQMKGGEHGTAAGITMKEIMVIDD